MRKPKHLDPLAELILERLRKHPASSEIILGGYLGLQHYLDYRRTHDIALNPPQLSPWPPILIETLRDNLASKMNALVNRGAPRDLLDIRMAVHSGLVSRDECWELWSLKNPGQRVAHAKAKALIHLENLEQRRPLSQIENPSERTQSQAVREWFRREFLEVKDTERRLPDRKSSQE
jgi:hypothetical protein